ncbi:MAG: hypothetical protein ACFCGT_13430 [Sandaracinaceae bacterium]
MDVLGFFALAYGLVTLALRFTAPDGTVLAKLAPAQDARARNRPWHWLLFTVLPVAVGAALLLL